LSRSKAKVAIKYCGSCNPQVNLAEIAAHLREMASRRWDFEIVPLGENNIDVVVILCGCPRACVNREDVKAVAKHSLLVADGFLQGKPVSENSLLGFLEKELDKIIKPEPS
jgi:hypothetical protein